MADYPQSDIERILLNAEMQAYNMVEIPVPDQDVDDKNSYQLQHYPCRFPYYPRPIATPMPIEVPATPNEATTPELEKEEAPSKEAEDKENKPTRTLLHDIQIIPRRNMASENIEAKQQRLHQ
ncbi:hypothetical protein BGX38DRAFT_1272759 [Terfezia claveryi]|nr:hypothetical protein BGX38DRAFT_1272759 [Terfezia claveryi]